MDIKVIETPDEVDDKDPIVQKDDKSPPVKKLEEKKPRGRPKGSVSKTASPTGKKINIEKEVTDMLTMIGTGVGAFNETDGIAIISGAPRFAKAVSKKADQDPKVKAALERMLTGTGWGEVIFAAGMMLFPIAVNHNLVPATLLGVDMVSTDGSE
jgi:hypothetical protein